MASCQTKVGVEDRRRSAWGGDIKQQTFMNLSSWEQQLLGGCLVQQHTRATKSRAEMVSLSLWEDEMAASLTGLFKILYLLVETTLAWIFRHHPGVDSVNLQLGDILDFLLWYELGSFSNVLWLKGKNSSFPKLLAFHLQPRNASAWEDDWLRNSPLDQHC